MTEAEILRVGAQLGVAIPESYRTLLLNRSEELQITGFFDGDLSPLFLLPAQVIYNNLEERADDAGTQYAFPAWWDTFFLIGTNGAGDYFALKLDGSEEVWLIGSDCGNEPTLISPSIETFVNKRINECNEEREVKKRVELDRTRRREPFQLEFAAHREKLTNARDLKIAEKWFGATDFRRMLEDLAELPYKVSPRKFRLLGIAGCNRIDACRDDTELAAALKLAERLILGTANEAELETTYAALNKRRKELGSTSSSWPITAVQNLLRYDRATLNWTVFHPIAPELVGVLETANRSLYGSWQGTIAECELFWEILGLPFFEVQFAQSWRTPAVTTLALHIYATQDFSQMPRLAKTLTEAGCDDSRLIRHCERVTGHARGCWVLDLILENEPNPFELPFTWDFKCQHPTIEAKPLKEKLEQFGAAIQFGSSDVPARLDFADWLQAQGDLQWANYIRVRCALDGVSPASDYIDLVEKQIESAIGRWMHCTFQDLYFKSNRITNEWWSSESISYYRGLPSLVHAVSPSMKSAGPSSILIKRLNAMMQSTPVRGVDFKEHYAEEMESILGSSLISDLRFLAFTNWRQQDSGSPVITALAKSSIAHNLEYLSIQNGIRSDDEAFALARTNFRSLRRLDMEFGGIDCSAKAAETVLTSSWFKMLGQLYCGFGVECAALAMRQLQAMPQLHSLALYRLPKSSVEAFDGKTPMPSVRRLALLETELRVEECDGLCNLTLPGLMELSLIGCRLNGSNLNRILASPLAGRLQALFIKEPSLDESSLEVLARNPCASEIRILQLECGDDRLNGRFQSLGSSALAGGVFSALTTLTISTPFASNAKPDTAEMLKRLIAPNLRHLKLESCEFDDECAAALRTNPSFAKLTRLTLEQKPESTGLLSPQAAETLFRSSNLKNVLEIELNRIEFGETITFIGDTSVLPNLKWASIWGTKSTPETQKRIRERRPTIHFGS